MVDAEELAKRLKKDRVRVTLFISEAVYEAFQTWCEEREVKVSNVVEEFMADALKEQKEKKSKR